MQNNSLNHDFKILCIFIMHYRDACEFLHCEYRSYTPDEIKKIYKEKIRLYHPDKRINESKEIIERDYFKFTNAIESLQNGINYDEDKNFSEIAIIIISEMYDLSNFISDMQNERLQNKIIKSPTQHINYNVSTFDLFACTSFSIDVPIAYESVMKNSHITFSFSPDNIERKFESIGHKNYGQSQGDIVVRCVHYNDLDEYFYYNEKNKELLVYKELLPKHNNKIIQVILPCNTIIETLLPVDNVANMHFCGYHPKYKFIKVYLALIK
jgi:hypothetical protein